MRLRFIAFGLAVCVGSVSLGASTKHEKEGKAGKKLEHHFEGIVARWLTSAGKLELGGRTVEEVSHEIITRSGWSCYATLVQAHVQKSDLSKTKSSSEVFGVPKSVLDEIYRICGGTTGINESPPPLASVKVGAAAGGGGTEQGQQWVFNRQHNGLGNQVFQYIFSRLMAESTGRHFRTSLLVPALGESPWKKVEFPPNSVNGWTLFLELFDGADRVNPSGRARMARDGGNASMAGCLRENGRCSISDRPWDQHQSKQTLLSQMIRALYSNECASQCIFTIGYFQEPLFFAPYRRHVLEWLGPDFSAIQSQQPAEPVGPGYPPLGPNDIVVHVRCCQHSGGGCDWLYLPFEYYDAVLSRLTARHPRSDVFLVAPCAGDCAMVEAFRRKYRATHVTPKAFRHHDKALMVDAMANDFRFLLRAPMLVLGKSTFGFWAGFLSPHAAAVHMPVESRRHHFEKIPVVTGDNRFVYHNPGADEWFGQAQGGEGAMRYEERGRWFGPKTLDAMGNFIVNKEKKQGK